MRTNWKIMDEGGYDLNLMRYRRYLEEKGYRESTLESYLSNIARYLEFVGTDKPTHKNIDEFKEAFLFSRHLSWSSINNYYCTIMQYHKMLGDEMKISLLRANEHLPLYFDEDDVNRIFMACHNLKHYAMLQTLFFGCLRASELCHLEDRDLDLKNYTIRVREGKGGKDGIALISEECACTLKQYLEVRPPAEGKHQPLFYTDFNRAWERTSVNRMFSIYKRKAGVDKPGGSHVFSRHTTATLMISRGVPLNIVQKLLRHSDIRTTLRYAHVSEKVAREWYSKCLTL
jgi:integrase/recombinase XerD